MNKLPAGDTHEHRGGTLSAVGNFSRSAFLALIMGSTLSGCFKTEKSIEDTKANIVTSCDRILRNETLTVVDIEAYFSAIDTESKEIYIKEQIGVIENLLGSIGADTDIRTLMILEGWRQMRENHRALTIAMEAYAKNERDSKKVFKNYQRTIHQIAVGTMMFVTTKLGTHYVAKKDLEKTCTII